MIPAGVQATKRGRFCTRRPTFSGWKPSTSLAGSTRRSTRAASTCGGSGSWTRMPWISAPRVVVLAPRAATSAVVAVGGQPHRLVVEAELLAGARLAAHVDGGGGIVADEEHAQARAHAARGQGGHARPQLLADGARGRHAVEHPCAHAVTARMIAQRSPADGRRELARRRARGRARRAARRSTATPSAPASTTARAFARGDAADGHQRAAASSARARRTISRPTTGSGFSLVRVGKIGPDRHVVDRLRRRRLQLRRGSAWRRRAARPRRPPRAPSAGGRSSWPT